VQVYFIVPGTSKDESPGVSTFLYMKFSSTRTYDSYWCKYKSYLGALTSERLWCMCSPEFLMEVQPGSPGAGRSENSKSD
jgi:hypothetical protein